MPNGNNNTGAKKQPRKIIKPDERDKCLSHLIFL